MHPKPIRTTTPSGEAIVILAAADYDRLVAAAEDARDAAIADRALADHRAGRSEALSADEMRELLAAPTPLAFWRRRRGLTQGALAEAVGVSQNYLSQIETGQRAGDVQLHARLARRLGLAIEDLVAEQG